MVKSSDPETKNLFRLAFAPLLDADALESPEPMIGEHNRQLTRAECALLNFGKGSVGSVQVEICPFSEIYVIMTK